MALWGISTTTETSANNYAIPKHLSENDRTNTPWNCFADVRGWIYRRYHSVENSGLSSDFYDEVLVPVAGLNTDAPGANETGLSAATPVAVFFEDPNLASPISIGAGGTTGIGTGKTGYVHLVWNENVYCSAGATIRILRSTGTALIGTASSTGAPVTNYRNDTAYTVEAFNGQISNRIAFAFSVPNTGIGTALSIDLSSGVVGTITDFYNGSAAIKILSSDISRNIGGAGTYLSGVGIGTTTLTITA
jgi:hypothetical protein